MEMDMISDLPQSMLHHILSSLPQKDAVKTSVLSKSWRYLWYGRTNVEFCNAQYKGRTANLVSVLDEILIRYKSQNLSIQKFILKTIDPVSAPYLEKWIPIVMRNKGIETLHLSSEYSDDFMDSAASFALPLVIFKSESLREIEIFLEGFKISCTDNVFFRHLQKLRLHSVHIAEETLDRIMSSCPLIEEVSLYYCEGFKTIKLNNHNRGLKIFEFGSHDSRIEITDGVFFTRLKSVKLSTLVLTTKLFDSFRRNFPCLEELKLDYCHGDGLEEVKLASRSVKRLVIRVGVSIPRKPPIKVSIDAPNILKFVYQGLCDEPPRISFATSTSKKWESNIDLCPDMAAIDFDMSRWLHQLDEFLKGLSPSQVSLRIRLRRNEIKHIFFRETEELIEKVVWHLELGKFHGLFSEVEFLVDEKRMLFISSNKK